MSDILPIVQAISSVVANTYDGALDKDGKPVKIGLKREKDLSFRIPRTMDAFKVRFSANKMIITYQSEINLSDFHNKKMDQEIEQIMADIVSYLKKEYKAMTKKSLGLKKDGEIDISYENVSKKHNNVTARCKYILSDAKASEYNEDEKTVESWLGMDKK